MSKYSVPAVAVICEFNVLHRGHLRLLEKIREQLPDSVVCAIMSGDFVQRGEAAVYNKYERAKAAVRCGYDLVIELPPPFSFGAANRFASGGIGLISSLRVFDHIAFGCESDADKLTLASERLRSEEYETELKNELIAEKRSNLSFIDVKASVYNHLYGEALPDKPNDILAVEYLSALSKIQSDIRPCMIRRNGNESATVLRKLINLGNLSSAAELMPERARFLLESRTASLDNASAAILYILRNTSPSDLTKIADVAGGMENLVISSAKTASSWSELCGMISGKRISSARAKRTILNCLLDINSDDFSIPPSYCSLLAANQTGIKLMKEIKKQSRISVISRPAEAASKLQNKAEALYSLCFEPAVWEGWDKLKQVYIEE